MSIWRFVECSLCVLGCEPWQAHELEAKHQITSKVGGMLGTGMERFTNAMKGAGSQSASGTTTLPAVPKV